MRAREMQVREFAESIGANPLGWNDAVGHVLDFLDDVDAMIGLSAVVDKIRTLPEWPQLRAVIRLAVLAWSSPSVLWVANKAFERLTVYFAV